MVPPLPDWIDREDDDEPPPIIGIAVSFSCVVIVFVYPPVLSPKSFLPACIYSSCLL
jgi:hypothetical protein